MVAGLVGAFWSEGDCGLRQGWVVVGLCSGVFMYGVEDESFSSFGAVVEKQIAVAFTRRGGGWDSAWDPTDGIEIQKVFHRACRRGVSLSSNGWHGDDQRDS